MFFYPFQNRVEDSVSDHEYETRSSCVRILHLNACGENNCFVRARMDPALCFLYGVMGTQRSILTGRGKSVAKRNGNLFCRGKWPHNKTTPNGTIRPPCSHPWGPWTHVVEGIKVVLTRLWLCLQRKSQAWPNAFSHCFSIWQCDFLLPSMLLWCCLPWGLAGTLLFGNSLPLILCYSNEEWVNTAGVHYNNTKRTKTSRYIKDKLLKTE